MKASGNTAIFAPVAAASAISATVRAVAAGPSKGMVAA